MSLNLNLNRPSFSVANNNTENRPKAEFWMNVGYTVEVEIDGEMEERFISLPFGIPLDSMKPLELKGSSDLFVYLRQAQNQLLEAVMEAAHQLQPGEAKVIGAGDQLAVEIRRIRGERTDVKSDVNPFVKKIKF